MAALPFAISIHHFISSVGSDAGFASIIGLAILVLLYFAQARETARIREQAADSAGRVQELEARLTEIGRVQASTPAAALQHPGVAARAAANPAAVSRPGVGGPARAGVGGPVISRQPAPASAGSPTLAPSAPAGVAAPALAAATKLIPAGGFAASAAPMPVGATAGAALSGVAEAGGSGRGLGSGSRSGGTIAPEAPIDLTTVGSLPPATAAAGGNGVRHDRVSPAPSRSSADAPAPSRSSADAPAPARSPGSPPQRIQIRPDARNAGARRPMPAAPARGTGDRDGGRVWGRFALLLGAVAVVGVVAALLILTSGGGSNPATSSQSRATSTPSARNSTGAAAVTPSRVTVAVLNGTATSGLAHKVATRLMGAGYKEGTIGNTADQTRTSTVVAYLPGNRRQAQAVATSLKLPSSAVQPVDSSTQAIACPPPSACSATVVVTVGSDLATQ